VSERVGFIGLGVMGKPMAGNLLAAGQELVVHNRSSAAVGELVSSGAESAGSPREVAEACEVVMTMLPDSDAVRSVVLGKDGVLAGVREGSLLIDMSTIHPEASLEIASAAAKTGAVTLDAPVSGGDVGARDATLSIMVGGDAAAFVRARPLLEVLGQRIVHVGGDGAGQIVKACNQLVVAVTIAAVSEALVLGSKAGVDPANILDVLGGGLAQNRVMEMRRRNFLEHDFAPGFRIDLHHKDLDIALETGGAYGVPLLMTGLVQQLFRALRAQGHGGDDHSALLRLFEYWAVHEIESEEAAR
jgi:2-hydroxy-3-oxopropionate reductase